MDPDCRAVLDWIRTAALRTERVNWARIDGLAATSERHDHAAHTALVREIVTELDDGHSFVLDPDEAALRQRGQATTVGMVVSHRDGRVATVSPAGDAAHKGIRVGDRIATVDDKPVTAYGRVGLTAALRRSAWITVVGRTDPLRLEARVIDTTAVPTVKLLDEHTGGIVLPPMSGATDLQTAYVRTAHRELAAAEAHVGHPIDRWVVDLRLNTGGTMWPMLAALAPLLEEGRLGGFVTRQGTTGWSLTEGQIQVDGRTVIDAGGSRSIRRVPPTVAVLTGPLTVSSGEFVAVALAGRPNTRRLGEPTAGLPTVNDSRPLPDGSLLCLTTGVAADRLDRRHDSELNPDETVPIEKPSSARQPTPS